MRQTHNEYELDDDRSRVDVERVHGWLSGSYWSPGIFREVVERGIRGASLVVSAYDQRQSQQVGFLRIISDKATFAWVADVFVDESHRGRGLARAMLGFAMEHPEHQNMRRWVLATKDAHGVYESLGFKPLPYPERWMILHTDPAAWSASPIQS
ncbi:MAG TPA: GNAT family N-acetyltransferase [Tepidisphaeraceae bacterium]|jgi:GNAT superfamily N-acetyltransferase